VTLLVISLIVVGLWLLLGLLLRLVLLLLWLALLLLLRRGLVELLVLLWGS
jgi:hypothetical protein